MDECMLLKLSIKEVRKLPIAEQIRHREAKIKASDSRINCSFTEETKAKNRQTLKNHKYELQLLGMLKDHLNDPTKEIHSEYLVTFSREHIQLLSKEYQVRYRDERRRVMLGYKN